MKRLAFALIAGAALLLLAGSAAAQTGYQLDNVSDSSPRPGDSVTVHVNGCSPNSQATITLASDPVMLGTTTTDAQGVVHTVVTLPDDVSSGSHDIVVSCVDRDGAVKEVRLPIVVTGVLDGLAITGSNISLLLTVALICVGVGAALVRLARQQAAV